MSDPPPDPPPGPGPDPSPPILRVRGPRASSVIVHRFPADHADAFMEWLHGITDAAGAFPGYQATEIYPPTGVSDADADGDDARGQPASCRPAASTSSTSASASATPDRGLT